MSRLGKIARLPRERREELNVRVQNGEVGRLLVERFNGLPAAQAVLATAAKNETLLRRQSRQPSQGSPGGMRQNDTVSKRDRIKPNQGQSSQIKVNQGKSSLRGWGVGGQCNRGEKVQKRRRYCGCATYASFRGYGLAGRESSPIKANQGKSSQIKPVRVGGRVGSGQWTVVSGQWLVAKEGGGIRPGQTQSNQPSPAAKRSTKATVPKSPREDGTVPAVEPAGYGLASPVKPSQTQSNPVKAGG
jgi:hypothetical protein